MSDRLQEFTIWPKCRKCGFDDYQTDHYNDVPATEYKRGFWLEDSQMNVENMGHMDEYLLRTCKRCGFQWAEECFNSNEGGE